MSEAPQTIPAEYSWWWQAVTSRKLPPQDSQLECGRYRLDRKGAAKAVAIWTTQRMGQPVIHVQINDRHFDTTTVKGTNEVFAFESEEWPECQAISADDYEQAMRSGKWHDEAPILPYGRTLRNQAGDPLSNFWDAYRELSERTGDLLNRWMKAERAGKPILTLKEEADSAQNIRAKIKAVKDACEEKRLEATRPLRKIYEDEHNRWKPLEEAADEAMKKLNITIVGPFLRAEQKKIDEDLAKEKARLAAEKKAAMEAAAKSAEPASVEAVEAQFKEPERKMATVGARGSAAKTSAKKDVMVDDWPKLAAHLSGHPDVQDVLIKVARKQFAANPHADIPGARWGAVDTTRG